MHRLFAAIHRGDGLPFERGNGLLRPDEVGHRLPGLMLRPEALPLSQRLQPGWCQVPPTSVKHVSIRRDWTQSYSAVGTAWVTMARRCAQAVDFANKKGTLLERESLSFLVVLRPKSAVYTAESH